MNGSENSQAISSMFHRDDEAAALHREATALKEQGDWAGAIAKLEAAKVRMLVSSVSYPYATWCRLAKFLQYAGRYDEAMKEFDFLLSDLERRARKECFFDNDNVRTSEPKAALVKDFVKRHQPLIEGERKRVQTREAKRLKKLLAS